MKTALVLLFSFIPSLRADSTVLAFGNASLGNVVTTVTASCSASGITSANCSESSSAPGLYVSFGASATSTTFGTVSSENYGYGVNLEITNTIAGRGSSTINVGSLGSTASFSQTFTINSPFPNGYFALFYDIGVWGNYVTEGIQGVDTFVANGTTVVVTQSSQSLALVAPSFVIPFTSGIPNTLTVTLSAGNVPPVWNITAGSDPYGGAGSSLEGLLVFYPNVKLDGNLLNIQGSALPQYVPEPSTFLLIAVAAVGLLMVRMRRRTVEILGTQN